MSLESTTSFDGGTFTSPDFMAYNRSFLLMQKVVELNKAKELGATLAEFPSGVIHNVYDTTLYNSHNEQFIHAPFDPPVGLWEEAFNTGYVLAKLGIPTNV